MVESMILLKESLKEALNGNICNQDGLLCVSEEMILEYLKDSASSCLEIVIIEEGIKFNKSYGSLGIFMLSFMIEILDRCPYSSWFKAAKALNASKLKIERELNANLARLNFTEMSLILDILSQSLYKLRPFTNKRNLCLIILECFLKTIDCSDDNIPYLSNRVSFLRINSSSLSPISQYNGFLFEVPYNLKVKEQRYLVVLYIESILPESFTASDKNASAIVNFDEFSSLFGSIVQMHTDLNINLILCQKIIPQKLKMMFYVMLI
ncbi:unnamed protein product [Blepharisma stoltei]|uniref:Uncharacterized protein n=1 Tax=Blepharisma stoltei TaxID=1481888 RepID=A0AAU9IWD2_9CILI|nr:unnamed protein product [Blepharisma stoltei]